LEARNYRGEDRRKEKMSYGKNRETRGLFLIIW
jgi:hypothetical protein